MSTYTALNGKIRLYDSTDVLRSLAGGDVQTYDFSTTTFADVTAKARDDDVNPTGPFCVDASDLIYVGHSDVFARVLVDLHAAAEGAGALVAKYYNGSGWVALTVEDGTAVAGDTLAQNGVISFFPPADWAKGGDASLSSTKYYVQLATTDIPTVAPDAEQIYPVDGQYLDLVFDEGNLSAPEGVARPEETPILHRGRIDSNYHYILGNDVPVIEPREISFSIRLSTLNDENTLIQALTCGDANTTEWGEDGTSTKTDSKLVSGAGVQTSTAQFENDEHKSICIQVLWTRNNVQLGRSYNEVYISPDQISLAESEEGVILSVTGTIYGLIEPIYHLAYRF